MVPPEGHPSGPAPWFTGAEPAPPREVVDPGNKFSDEERRTANLLRTQGNAVERLPENVVAGQREADTLVNGRKVEFKTAREPSLDTLRNRVRSTWRKGRSKQLQAENVILDVRGVGVDRARADELAVVIKRQHAGRLKYLRVIGDGFDVTYSDLGT